MFFEIELKNTSLDVERGFRHRKKLRCKMYGRMKSDKNLWNSPKMVIVEFEPRYGHPQLLKAMLGNVLQLGMRNPQRYLLLRRKFASESVGYLAKRFHLFTFYFDALTVRRMRNDGRKILLTTVARADFSAHSAVQARTRRQAQQGVKQARHFCPDSPLLYTCVALL